MTAEAQVALEAPSEVRHNVPWRDDMRSAWGFA